MEESTIDILNSWRQVAGIILAAGSGSRFGSDKRQVVGPRGDPMLHHVLATFRPCFEILIVVIPARDEFGRAACEQFAALAIQNTNSAEGIGSSLRLAAGWLEKHSSIRACVIGLGDMPLIRPETVRDIRELVAMHEELIAPCARSQLGFPRALPRSYFSQLAQLQGDVGASAVIDWSSAIKLFVDDSSVLLDIDTPKDLELWQR